MEIMSIGEAKARFSELVSRTMAGERFLIRRRNRAVAALIAPAELERLERLCECAQRLALVLGQQAEILEQVQARQIHPAMAAFGLWREAEDLQALEDEIALSRQQQTPRSEIVL